jgi:tetratricopeptide (TPR) repeat protein
VQYRRILDAHADYYSGLMEEAFALAERDDESMLMIVEQDIDNVRSAWRHCLASQNGAGAFKMVPALWSVYEIRGWVAPAVELFDEALDAFDEGSDDQAIIAARALASACQAWFLALIGEPERGVAAADDATEVLRARGDSEVLCIALLCRIINIMYLGRVDDWIAVADEGVALGKRIDGPFWTAAFKQFRGGAAITAGDLDTAKRVILEATEVFGQLGAEYWMSANLNHQAQVAIGQGRIEDAIDLFSRSVERGRALGAVRVMLMSTNGLGEANLAAGNLEAAESAFIDSLATAEQMGTVREMLNLIGKVAQIRAATEQQQEAVELLATVVADPTSAYPAIFQSVPIADVASEALTELQDELDTDEYTAAHDAGTARFYAVAVKELIASGSEA